MDAVAALNFAARETRVTRLLNYAFSHWQMLRAFGVARESDIGNRARVDWRRLRRRCLPG
jgi:hypothetical protein